MDNGEHRRRWPNIYQTLDRCHLYFADTLLPTESTVQSWMVDGRRRRWWISVEPALGWRVLFAGDSMVGESAADTGPHSYSAYTGYSHNAVSSTFAQNWNSTGWMTRVCWVLAINLLAAGGETSPVFVYKNSESYSFFVYRRHLRLDNICRWHNAL